MGLDTVVEPTQEVFWRLFTLYTVGAVILGGIAIALLVYMALRYRASRPDELPEEGITPGYLPSIKPAAGWSRLILVLTGIIVTGLTLYSFIPLDYLSATPSVPEDSERLTIWVTGRQFYWEFEYPGGIVVRSPPEVAVLPVSTLVEFKVTSADVFHSFGIPFFKVKIDSIPGVLNTIWIVTPPSPGEYSVFCYELCGVGHSLMVGKIRVVSMEEYLEWLEEKGGG